MNQRFRALQELGEQFEQAVRDADMNANQANRTRTRFSAVVSRLFPRLGRLWALVGVAGVALIAGLITATVLLSSGTPAAYAGWSPVPTTPTPSALATAVHKCYKVDTSDSQLALPAPDGNTQPVLAEARGRSAAAVYVIGAQVYMCLYENGFLYTDGVRYTNVASSSMGPVRVAPGPDQLSIPYGVNGGSGSSTLTHPLTAAQIQKSKNKLLAALQQRARTSLLDVGGYYALGQAGADVSSVTFSFANGKTVTASLQNGWYFAWWPWTTDPTSVTVTTNTGTTTSPMKDTWPGGLGSRPYPACQPGSNGCVFAAKQPAQPTPTTTTTTTPTGTSTAPATTAPQVATATQQCDAFTLTYQVMSADAFAGPPVITDVHGISTALLNVTNGRVDACLVGGDQKNFHAFFAWHIETYGRIRQAPGPDQLSVPYTGHNGVGGGRVASSLIGEPPALDIGPRATPAQLEARLELMDGGGYGPYTFGQAGSDVSAVTLAFANGKTIVATVANGWYFAWWPWISPPTSVTVTTSSGTTTSPVTSSNGLRVAVVPGCQPGSSGCVFAKTPAAPITTTSTTTTGITTTSTTTTTITPTTTTATTAP